MALVTGTMQSNLGCFLDCTTPLVPRRFLPEGETRGLNRLWHPSEREKVEYFSMADLWSCYDEWSAYGAGVPITLASGEALVQYYVPYLSAIQIYTSDSAVRSFREDTTDSGDGEGRDSFSDSCSSEGSEKSWRSDRASSSEDAGGFDPCLDERLGLLYFQHIERSTPYGRAPLMDKISGFAQRYPGLMSLRSVDLSPASWMSVAWYPIYHIPMGRTIKDLSTCFLTYHTLSSSFEDIDKEMEDMARNVGSRGGEGGIPLPAFGLATYKMQGDVWVSMGGGHDQERLASLLAVADSWLRQLGVRHHDFDYFAAA